MNSISAVNSGSKIQDKIEILQGSRQRYEQDADDVTMPFVML